MYRFELNFGFRDKEPENKQPLNLRLLTQQEQVNIKDPLAPDQQPAIKRKTFSPKILIAKGEMQPKLHDPDANAKKKTAELSVDNCRQLLNESNPNDRFELFMKLTAKQYKQREEHPGSPRRP